MRSAALAAVLAVFVRPTDALFRYKSEVRCFIDACKAYPTVASPREFRTHLTLSDFFKRVPTRGPRAQVLNP